MNPSKELYISWITALNKTGNYPKMGANRGKWMVFIPLAELDEVWEKIKIATENGILGGASKSATARRTQWTKGDSRLICVYTYDVSDEDDVMRIRKELRNLGVTQKISYKTDKATAMGKYSKFGSTVSAYYE